jgi:hypothetical protein
MFVSAFFESFGIRSGLSSYGRLLRQLVLTVEFVQCKVSLIALDRAGYLVVLGRHSATDGERHRTMINQPSFELFSSARVHPLIQR